MTREDSDANVSTVASVVRRLAVRDRLRSEATIQADVRQLLLSSDLGLGEADLEVHLETQVGDRRRIDVEVGFTVIEVKKDLRTAGVVVAAEAQLAGYVASRTAQVGQRYIGILTDGQEWRAYQLVGSELVESTRLVLGPARPEAQKLITWLEGVLATRAGVPPTPSEIERALGASSASHALDRAALEALYLEFASLPTVRLKRNLWSGLLRSALGTQFTDEDSLFIEHTLLVNSAEIIAHLVLGLDVNGLAAATLLRGDLFSSAGVHGVVEQDFFDWVVEVPGGDAFIRSLARRLSRFEWSAVEHDVLKVLYESVIGSETRKRLGEYYTPDWLADRVIAATVDQPLTTRVLDPSCGSGTFLFHGVRNYLAAADQQGRTTSEALAGLADSVLGIDLHPVAVALARVTYLLAIGRSKLVDPDRGPINIPVYLGDSVQWQQQDDLLTAGHLVVPTGTGGQLFESELRFPERLLSDAARFDELVSALADQASKPRGSAAPRVPTGLLKRLAIAEEDVDAVEENYRILCQLHDEGRDHIWSYYVRNLARPLWLSRSSNRVDALVGNPPWLSFRHMPEDMQQAFKVMSQARGLWQGQELATHQDLSGLFIARAAQQYLRPGGRFGFVVPNAVLDRGYFSGFRSGEYRDSSEPMGVQFDDSWDLRRLRPHFFPRGSGVVFGSRSTPEDARPLPRSTIRWTGRLPRDGDSWSAVSGHVSLEPELLSTRDDSGVGSPYGPRFNQGATFVPRLLFVVEDRPVGPLGMAVGKRPVRSARSSTEKAPWRDLAPHEGLVETQFIRRLLVGESVLPYRLLSPKTVVAPILGGSPLIDDDVQIELYPGLSDWWHRAESLWLEHRSSDRLSLSGQLNCRYKLSAQLPAPGIRVVYAASGMYVVAAVATDSTALIDKSLYWASVETMQEAMFLLGILNSACLTDLVRPLMSYGKDERHIDKALWELPIPRFDASIPEHVETADLAKACLDLVATFDVNNNGNPVTLRRTVRRALAERAVATNLDDAVRLLLDS